MNQVSKTDLSKYNNDWFKKTINASFVKRCLWYYVSLVFFIPRWNIFNAIKIILLKLFGAQIGKGVVIKPSVNIKYPWHLKIGHHSWIGENVWIDNLTTVTIGSNVCISQGAMLLTGNHDYTKETFDLMIGPIIVEDGAWVGAMSLVCPGVTVFSHAVLTAKSVATKNLEAYTINQGNPAIKVKDRTIL
jgi:putative colanic acid biosynthesis acetyltransferase WcaF